MTPPQLFTSDETLPTRGLLIVVEGLDRSGKSTQTQLLTEALNSARHQRPTELWKYPNRETELGVIIDKYLRKKIEMDDHAVHLIFSANRWEFERKMREKLNSGTSLVVDRYAYSGVAYTAAKPGMDFEWCKQCDAGLIKPDLLVCYYINKFILSVIRINLFVILIKVFMDTKLVDVEKREGFGEERYENVDFQSKVYVNFKRLLDLNDNSNQLVLNAKDTIENIHETILNRVLEMKNSKKFKSNDFKKLW